MDRKEILSCFYDTPLLFTVYSVFQIGDSAGIPGFHLDEYEGVPIQGNQIHLSPGGAEIGGQDTHPRLFQGPGGVLFPRPAFAGAMHSCLQVLLD
jgi:hypothetical protein